MGSRRNRTSRWGMAAILFLVSGCHSVPGHDEPHRCRDFCPGDVPPPHGAISCAWQDAQHSKAVASQWVIFQNSWYQGGDQLGPAARDHLQKLVPVIQASSQQLIVEPEQVMVRRDLQEDYGKSEEQLYDEALAAAQQLDARRREVVVATLLDAGIADADQRVVLAHPPYDALYGQDALQAFRTIEFGGGMFGGRFGGMGLGGVGFGGGGFGGGLGGGWGGGGFGGIGGWGGGF